jgi:integrase
MGIRKRGDRWLVTVEIGSDERGVRRRRHVTCTSEVDAKREEAVLTAEVLTGTYVEPSTDTVAEFLTEWLRHAGRGNAQSTRDCYLINVRTHLIPALGRIKLAQLRPMHVERFLTAQARKGLAPATIDKHYWTLHKALDRAVAWGKLVRNPADQVDKPGQQDSCVRSFDVVEQAQILGRAAGAWMYGPILVAMATGMRRGEIVALRWRDLDLGAGTIAVRGSVQEDTGGVSMGTGKTTASVRVVRVPASICSFLSEHRDKQRMLAGAVSTYRDAGLVFAREDGSIKRPSVVTNQFGRICERLGIEDAHFHCLRHTFATEMLRAGVNVKVVSEMLGHASVSTTLRIYAHVLEDMQADAALRAGVIVAAAMGLVEN